MATEALTTVAAVKTYLGETGSTYDTLLGVILDGVEEAVGRFCRPAVRESANNPLTSYSDTEYYSGDGFDELYLRRFPVTAITSVKVDSGGYFGHGSGGFGTDTEWTIGDEFAPAFDYADLRNIGLLKSLVRSTGPFGRAWPKGVGNIEVVYTAGFSTTPDDLAMAIWQLAQRTWAAQKTKLGELPVSETHSRYSYTLLTSGKGAEVAEIRETLMRYKAKHQ